MPKPITRRSIGTSFFSRSISESGMFPLPGEIEHPMRGPIEDRVREDDPVESHLVHRSRISILMV
jgi:hypothetical protein